MAMGPRTRSAAPVIEVPEWCHGSDKKMGIARWKSKQENFVPSIAVAADGALAAR